jgi:hypothetical protein
MYRANITSREYSYRQVFVTQKLQLNSLLSS